MVLFHKDACTGTGRTVIRITTKTGDSGRGPLELAAVPKAQDIPEDCHGDGDVDINGDGVPDDNDVLVRSASTTTPTATASSSARSTRARPHRSWVVATTTRYTITTTSRRS